MDNTVRKAEYFYVMVPNSPGQASKIMSGLVEQGVNLLAFSGFPSGRRAQLDLIPEDSAALKRAAKKLGLTLSAKKTGTRNSSTARRRPSASRLPGTAGSVTKRPSGREKGCGRSPSKEQATVISWTPARCSWVSGSARSSRRRIHRPGGSPSPRWRAHRRRAALCLSSARGTESWRARHRPSPD